MQCVGRMRGSELVPTTGLGCRSLTNQIFSYLPLGYACNAIFLSDLNVYLVPHLITIRHTALHRPYLICSIIIITIIFIIIILSGAGLVPLDRTCSFFRNIVLSSQSAGPIRPIGL